MRARGHAPNVAESLISQDSIPDGRAVVHTLNSTYLNFESGLPMPSLHWRGKDAVLNHHLDVPYHLLRCQPELSAGCPGSGNLIVEGDNLLALKALLPYYKGQVKCIYIDPPYNTGNEEWIYNDNVNSSEIRAWLGQAVGRESEDLNRHDKWLCMMWPRLQLLKQFLHPAEGSIWVSIDDNEGHRLKLIMDEIFGAKSFVASIAWESRYSRSNDAMLSISHNTLHLYVMDPETWKTTRNRLPRTQTQSGQYKNLDDDPRGPWRAIPWDAPNVRPNLSYPIHTPSGDIRYPPPGRHWSRTEEQWQEIVDSGMAYFGKNGNGAPAFKQYLESAPEIVPNTWWPHEEAGHTDEAKKEMQALFPNEVSFPTPKPVRLIERVLQIATSPGDLILDSFAGSGTTAHAVMKLNAEDGGDRRFILVEMDPAIARPVTAERVRRVARGYTNNKGEAVPGLGSDFRYCTLGAPLFRGNGSLNEDLTRDTLSRHLFFTEFGEPLSANPPSEGSLVGTFGDTALHLLWDADGPGFLDAATLRGLPVWDGEYVIYGEGCAVPASILQERRVSFRQVPYRVRG
jgi:adenine-specific DNA-methyltransferase